MLFCQIRVTNAALVMRHWPTTHTDLLLSEERFALFLFCFPFLSRPFALSRWCARLACRLFGLSPLATLLPRYDFPALLASCKAAQGPPLQ